MKQFEDVTKSMIDLYQQKNQDYGNSFERSLDEFGILPAVIRLNDKMNRIKQLTKNKQLVDESIEDTLLDLANYAVMTLCWLNKSKS